MHDLGRSQATMYPANEGENKKSYQSISLPKKMFEGHKLALDDTHHFTIKGKIVGHDPERDMVHVEMMEGEKMDNPKEEAKEGEAESVLGKA